MRFVLTSRTASSAYRISSNSGPDQHRFGNEPPCLGALTKSGKWRCVSFENTLGELRLELIDVWRTDRRGCSLKGLKTAGRGQDGRAGRPDRLPGKNGVLRLHQTGSTKRFIDRLPRI